MGHILTGSDITGAMGTFQILLFALIAIKIKANAPGAHTFPEIVLARHGKIAHLTYLFNGLATNMLVGACLVLGGSQVVAALTGMNVYGACFLIPLVVAAYVIAGGLRSTFIADYVHTVVLFIAIFVFGFMVYATSDLIGSIDKFYDLLVDASKTMPIATNTEGSYLAFRSVDGLVFAIDLFAAGFSTVWLDQAYWQRAIASKPETSVRAYILVSQLIQKPRFQTALTEDCVAGRNSMVRNPIRLRDSDGPGLRCFDWQSKVSDISKSSVRDGERCWSFLARYSHHTSRPRRSSLDAGPTIHGRHVFNQR